MILTRRSFLHMTLAGAGGLAVAGGTAPAQEKSAKGGRIKQSLAWWAFARKGVDHDRLIKEAASLGYAAIELVPRNLWDKIRQAGMVIACTGGHGSIKDGLNRRENHDRIEKELLKNIDLAVQYQIPGLICFSGNRDGISDEEGIANTADGLKRVAKAAEEKKVTLCMELLNSRGHKGYQCDHTAWGVEVCKRVNSPAVKLLYDVYHMQIMEGNIIGTIRKNIQYISHFHTGGNPGRHDLDDTQELCYPNILRAIADTGYQGYVGHEFIPKGDVFESIRKTFEMCNV